MAYDPSCETDTIVRVNGTRLPAGNVDIHIRREGPLAITRYAEVEFASPFKGEDYVSAFNGSDSDTQSDWDTIEIELRDTETETYTTTFRGLVTGLGNSADGNEKMWHCRSQGPGHFVNKIPAGKSFQGASMRDIVLYCAVEIAENVPFGIKFQSGGSDVQDSPERDDRADRIVNSRVVGEIEENSNSKGKRKTFKKNRHTIADVVKWVEEKTGARFWLRPDPEETAFVGTTSPTEREHKAHYLDGNLRIISNDALTELNPINSMTVKGKAASSLGSIGDFEINVGSNEYYAATAVHKPLLKRTGGQQYWGEPHLSSDAESAAEVRNVAKSSLKAKISQTTGGDMFAFPRSPIRPYDRITAKPTCQQSPATDTNPITYEVSRVHHKIRPSERSQTKLNVGIHAALDDIILTEGGWESITT